MYVNTCALTLVARYAYARCDVIWKEKHCNALNEVLESRWQSGAHFFLMRMFFVASHPVLFRAVFLAPQGCDAHCRTARWLNRVQSPSVIVLP